MTTDQVRRAIDRPDLWAEHTRAHAAADQYARRAHELEASGDGSEGAQDAIDVLWGAYWAELGALAPAARRGRGAR